MCLTATERERRFQELKIRRKDKIIGEILFIAGHGHQGRKRSQDRRFPVADGCLDFLSGSRSGCLYIFWQLQRYCALRYGWITDAGVSPNPPVLWSSSCWWRTWKKDNLFFWSGGHILQP